MKVIENKNKVDLARLKELESYYEISFPQNFIDFLNIVNGLSYKDLFSQPEKYAIDRFLVITKDNPYDIAVVMTQIESRLAEDPEQIGINLIPIAACFSGDFICLDFRNSKSEPSVCIWYHDNSDEFKPATKTIFDKYNEFIEYIKKLN